MEPYANIAAANAPPLEQQPHPDPALLTTPSVLGGPPPDITGTTKVNVVQSNYGEPSTYTTPDSPGGQASESGFPSKNSTSKRSETPTPWRWEKVKGAILRPSIAGGLVGIVNIGLLAGGSYAFYTHPNLRRDTRIIASTAAATFALFGIETYAIKVCQNKNATDRNDEEGSTAAFVRRFVHDYAPRSGVIGGTTGVVNACILGILGYLAYRNWDRPNWDRRSVSAASVGLLALLGCEMQYFRMKS